MAVDSRKRLQANYFLFTDYRSRDEDTLVFTVNGVRRGLHTAGPGAHRKIEKRLQPQGRRAVSYTHLTLPTILRV